MGLGIALAVAVYVTRVPIPFVDRNVSRNAGQDALEAERNKGWNPNKVLNGDVATPPAPAPAVPPEAAGAIVVPPADGKSLPPVPGRQQAGGRSAGRPGPVPAGHPGGRLLPLRHPAQPPAPGADPFTYFVQAGAFRTPEDAEAQRAKLAMLGINADVTEREQSGRTVYRVRVGPFNQKALADLTQEQLEVNGVEAALVRVQR